MITTLNRFGWDRIARIVLGFTLLVLGWGGFVTGPAGLFMQWFGFLPLLTGLAGRCPTIPFLSNGSSCSMKDNGNGGSVNK